MWLIQFNCYFDDYLHTFMTNYIHYIVSVCAQKITKFVAYLYIIVHAHRQ